jgi:hypothetical protein
MTRIMRDAQKVLLNRDSVRPPLELHGSLVRYGTEGSFGHSLSHLIAPWIAITTAHVTMEVLIITKSGIAVDLADFAMASYL